MYPGNNHTAIAENAKKFIDPATAFMKTLNEVEQEEKAYKAKKVQESIDAHPGLGFKINPDRIIPDDVGDKYTTTHKCFGSPCPKDEAFVQTEAPDQKSNKDKKDKKDYLLPDDTSRWTKYPYGAEPFPQPHDVHDMVRPDFNYTVYHNPSFAQKDKKDIQDDTTRWVKYPHGIEPFPQPHDVHDMMRPDFNTTVYHDLAQ